MQAKSPATESCDNCATNQVAYTLTTYVEDDPAETVELHFCSSDCLRVWT